jgi:hypothetical protein
MQLKQTLHTIILGLFLLAFSAGASAQKERWLVPYRSGKLWGLADTNAKVVIAPQFEEVDFAYHNRIRFKKKGLWGYLDEKGKVVIPAKYKSADRFSNFYEEEPAASVTDQNNVSYTISRNGTKAPEREQLMKEDVPPEEMIDNSAALKQLESLRQKLGQQYDSIKHAFYLPYGSNYLLPQYYKVYKNGKAGLIDHEQNVLIPTKYNQLKTYEREFIVASDKGKYRIINQHDSLKYGAILDSVIYTETYGIIHIKESGKWGILNRDFTMQIPPVYDDIRTSMSHPKLPFFSYGHMSGNVAWGDVYLLLQNGKTGAYISSKKYLVKPAYKAITGYMMYSPDSSRGNQKEYLYVRLENGKEGFVDLTGKKKFFK